MMERMVEFHHPQFYNADTGTFSSRGRAAIAAETLRKLLLAANPKLNDSRFVSIEGKAAGCYVYIPRLQHQWWPGHDTVQTEFEYVLAELGKELE